MIGRLLASSISLVGSTSQRRSIVDWTGRAPYSGSSWASQRKRPREDCGPAWPLCWLVSPARIKRRRRPLNLIQLYPTSSARKNPVSTALGNKIQDVPILHHFASDCASTIARMPALIAGWRRGQTFTILASSGVRWTFENPRDEDGTNIGTRPTVS